MWHESVWHPSPGAARGGAPAWRSRAEHAQATPIDQRWLGTLPPRRHLSSIYWNEFEALADLQADVLVSHEAGGFHPAGGSLIDDLVRSIGARLAVHGHHHDALDSPGAWPGQGFESRGVGLRGVSVLWSDGRWEVVVVGELDDERAGRG